MPLVATVELLRQNGITLASQKREVGAAVARRFLTGQFDFTRQKGAIEDPSVATV